MARLITKFKFLKPNSKMSIGGYAKYIATRDGVDKIDDSYKFLPATKNQEELIKRVTNDFPDSKNSFEYEDFMSSKTCGSASEFLSHTIEENAVNMLNHKTYADYIATRPRAERFGSHGLFTDKGAPVNLKKVSEELNMYQGNVWTAIISLKREDAERLGFNKGERWRDMLRSQTDAMSKELNIPLNNLKWFAAFHNESHHPHVHLIVYSTQPNVGYLSKKGIDNLRSAFAKDIFSQDLLCVYEKQTEHRNKLRLHSRELISKIVSEINFNSYDNPELEDKLRHLADRLSKTKGKKVYGYLKSDVKNIVDSIVDDLATDKRISKLYDLWYQQREEVIRTYTDEMPKRVPLSKNKEFKSIRNAVIQEAMNIGLEEQNVEQSTSNISNQTDNTPLIQDKENEEYHPQSSLNNQNNQYIAGGVIRLFHHASRIIQNKLLDECKDKSGTIDKKLKNKENEKKQAQGMRL